MTPRPGPSGEPLTDRLVPRRVVDSRLLARGHVVDFVSDRVELSDGDVDREYLRHPGAVGVVVLNEDDEILLIRQYRHAVRRELWEVPAGLLDHPGEDAAEAARRELAEEADLVASRWHVLVDAFTSPGCSDEAIRIYLARDIAPVPDAERFTRTEEESEIVAAWVPLDDAENAVLNGGIHNPIAIMGVLAAVTARRRGWGGLRSTAAAWPERSPGRPTA